MAREFSRAVFTFATCRFFADEAAQSGARQRLIKVNER
jgi:hypothetical protein